MELDWESLAERASLPLGADVVEPPTVKQVRFLEDLAETRDAPQDVFDDYQDTVEIGGLTKKKASYFIDAFLRYPKVRSRSKKRTPIEMITPLDSPIHRDFRAEVKTVPVARYAVPFDELFVEFLKTPVSGDLLFVEITERYGPKKMKRLSGSPGSFARSDLHIDDALAVLRVIAKSPYDYTALFSRHYKVCGRCGAELTDPKSRDIGLGPECRKHFAGISIMIS
jgi:hypothetical protein